MAQSPDPVETAKAKRYDLVAVRPETLQDLKARADAAEAALLLCQQDKDEAIREWRLSQQTETILQARADASASALTALQGYVQHQKGCELAPQVLGSSRKRVCTCGLSALLSSSIRDEQK